MNSLDSVEDISIDQVLGTRYDLALFACGYESRCTHFPGLVQDCSFGDVQVLGFETSGLPAQRLANEEYFKTHWHRSPIPIGQQLYPRLQQCLGASMTMDRPIRLLVDYSSMSRLWYSAILNFARFMARAGSVTIDFAYSPGVYSDDYAEELCRASVESLSALPGMEGLSASREKSVAVLGLGFTPLAGLGVLERLQPTSVLAFFAEPGTREEYAQICRTRNELLLAKSDAVFTLPLTSVEASYIGLCESMVPFLDDQQIAIIPMGPKPHVLTSMLVACRFRQVSCLYASMNRRDLSDIPATGQVVLTRILMSERGGTNESGAQRELAATG